MKHSNINFSKEIAKEIKSIPQRCFYNSSMIWKSKLIDTSKVYFVIGFLVDKWEKEIIEHAWNYLNRKIIDTTLFNKDFKYYSVKVFDMDQMTKEIALCKNNPTDLIFKYKDLFDKKIIWFNMKSGNKAYLKDYKIKRLTKEMINKY